MATAKLSHIPIQTLPDDQHLHDIFSRLQKANPSPASELYYINHYTLLVAVVLSARATDKGVNKATPPLFAIADTAEKMLSLGEAKLYEFIKTIGLAPTKAKNIIALSRILVADYNGQIPSQRTELENLPGVGAKTASVVLNIAFQQPTVPVDTHVFRVSNRIPLFIGTSPEAVQKGLERIIPQEFLHNAHHWLVLHGRYICKARQPLCDQCVIKDLCQFPGSC